MTKLIALRGLPASGKSTYAKELVESSGNFVRVNKDLLRKMLHNDKYTRDNEAITHGVARMIVKKLLSENTNVIVDDTNLNPKTMKEWESTAKEMDAKFEIKDIDTDVIECCVRDLQREESVGSTVIKNMALQYGKFVPKDDSVVICDLDGTLCNIDHRLHYVRNKENDPNFKKDWKGFFNGISEDKVNPVVSKKLIEEYDNGKTIIFVSARPDTYKEQTIAWLEKHNLSFGYTLIMRSSFDKREDTEVKKDILKKYFPNKKCIHLVIDDRPSVIRMWKKEGLTVMDVGTGVEF